jgi:serine/threonine-protein kinase
MTVDLCPGVVIGGRYHLERLIGEGGMGSVWAATHTLTRSQVALKFLKPEAVQHAGAVRRFMREARAATSVNHPNVIRVHDIFLQDDSSPVMVMDLLAGESLAQKLERERRIALPELATIMLPVISAVGSAHAAGIVHRDLKPDNIFLARMPEGQMSPKVLDFGIAKLDTKRPEAAQSAELTRTGAMLGTPYYMSPEQVFGEKDVDARADVWAVGVILYEALAGVRPVDGENLGQLLKIIATGSIPPIDTVAPDLPQAMRSLIGDMLKTDRNARLADLKPAFEVLGRFTSQLAQSFSEVQAFPRESLLAPGASEIPSGVAHALTPANPNDAAVGVPRTAGAFSTTHDSPVVPIRRVPAWPFVAGGVALIAVLGIVVGVRSGTTPEPAASTEQASATPVDSAAPAVQVAPMAGPGSSALEPAALADAAPASVPAQKTTRAGAKPTKAEPSANATPPPSATPAPSGKPATAGPALGGVAVEAPF